MYPSYVTDLRIAGFRDIETFSYDLVMKYSHESWRGRVRASGGVTASLSPDMVARFDENLRGILAERFRDEPLHLQFPTALSVNRTAMGQSAAAVIRAV